MFYDFDFLMMNGEICVCMNLQKKKSKISRTVDKKEFILYFKQLNGTNSVS